MSEAKLPKDRPPHCIDEDVLGLADEVSHLAQAASMVVEQLEQRVGLTHRELRVLTRLAQTGEVTKETPSERAHLETLERRGLAIRTEEGAAITYRGMAAHDQVHAIRIRLADHLLHELGPGQGASMRTMVQQMTRAMPDLRRQEHRSRRPMSSGAG